MFAHTFKEKQLVRKSPLAFLLLGLWTVLIFYFIGKLWIEADVQSSFYWVLLTLAIVVLSTGFVLTRMFWKIELKTEIDDFGIYFQMKPFHKLESHLEWNAIESIEVVRYNPFAAHRGWGLKVLDNGMALTIFGRHAIKIRTKKGPVLWLGTQKPKKAKKALKQ